MKIVAQKSTARMKKCTCLLAILLLCMVFSSCSYKVEYPEDYTPEYIAENYTMADPNLTPLYAASNGIYSGEFANCCYYYAIKNVPLDEYLFAHSSMLFMNNAYNVLKKKDKDLPSQEILSYDIQNIPIRIIFSYL
jgi:hypothetical protein